MNADELADLMEKYSTAGFMSPLAEEFKKAATMLRQQQAEIEALKMEIHSLTYGERLAEYIRKAQEK